MVFRYLPHQGVDVIIRTDFDAEFGIEQFQLFFQISVFCFDVEINVAIRFGETLRVGTEQHSQSDAGISLHCFEYFTESGVLGKGLLEFGILCLIGSDLRLCGFLEEVHLVFSLLPVIHHVHFSERLDFPVNGHVIASQELGELPDVLRLPEEHLDDTVTYLFHM